MSVVCRSLTGKPYVVPIAESTTVRDIFNRSRAPIEAAQAIKAEALRRRTSDNVSVSCVGFKARTQPAPVE
jgi:serine/threonine protein phosphatase PrpC